MLSFTTYKMPDDLLNKTSSPGKWLCLLIPERLSPQEESLLTKIIAALNADTEIDVELININDAQLPSVSISHVDTKLVISFGFDPAVIGLWIDLPSPGIRVLETMSFIRTLTLEELNRSPLGKKQLWSAIQLYLESARS